jgi:hypothetical protein
MVDSRQAFHFWHVQQKTPCHGGCRVNPFEGNQGGLVWQPRPKTARPLAPLGLYDFAATRYLDVVERNKWSLPGIARGMDFWQLSDVTIIPVVGYVICSRILRHVARHMLLT